MRWIPAEAGPGNAVDNFAVGVRDGKDHSRFRLAFFGLERIPIGNRVVLPLLVNDRFPSAATLLLRFQRVAEIVGQHGAVGRIGCGEEGISLAALFSAQHAFWYIQQRLLDGEQYELLGAQHFFADQSQWGIVVENVKAAAERRAHEIVFTLLDLEVAKRNRRYVAGEFDPMRAAVDGEEQAEFRPGKEQVLFHVVLYDAPNDMPIG